MDDKDRIKELEAEVEKLKVPHTLTTTSRYRLLAPTSVDPVIQMGTQCRLGAWLS